MKTHCLKLTVITVFFLLGLAILIPELRAHCDTLGGPVVSDAKKALESKDVTSVLKWVREDQEGIVRKAFQEALERRNKDMTVKEKTDMDFFSLIVKLHREAEGVIFKGFKPLEMSIDPVVMEADRALENGSMESLKYLEDYLSEEIRPQLRAKFNTAFEKRKKAEESVMAGREYVEAYTQYMHFVEDIHSTAIDRPLHHEDIMINHSAR